MVPVTKSSALGEFKFSLYFMETLKKKKIMEGKAFAVLVTIKYRARWVISEYEKVLEEN